MMRMSCGAFGRSLTRKDSIAALDAAAPLFINQGIMPSRDNVKFLEVIHTSASDGSLTKDAEGLLGIDRNFGHVDFYPNGGRRQPGCSECKLTSSYDSSSIFPSSIYIVYFFFFHGVHFVLCGFEIEF